MALVLTVAWAGVALPVSSATAKPRDTPSAAEVERAREAAEAAAGEVGRMQARLATARARLDALFDDEQRAVEAYNGARYRLSLAVAAADEARQRADVAATELAAAEDAVGRFAAAAYRMGGDLGGFVSMLDADGPTDLMNQASDLANVAASNDAALDRVSAARVVATVLREQADAAVAAMAEAAEEVRLAKEEAEARVAQQQAEVGGLQQLASRLSERLAQARAAAGDLARDRQQGLERERRREAREARENAEAAAGGSGGSGGSGGGGGNGGGTGGWSPSFTGGTSVGTKAGAAKAIAFARDQIGKPYEYAADGPDTFDCSGLTMMAWRAGGVSLPHWSVAQFAQAKKIPAAWARPGDLVFWATDLADPGTIHHVGLYVGGGMMIDAPRTGLDVRLTAVYSDGLIGFARP